MKPIAATAIRVMRMPLRSQQDVVACRQRTRIIADRLGIEGLEQIRLATAVSEIARNAVEYGKDGIVEFFGENSPPSFTIQISDHGRGIPHLADILAGRYESPTGLGRGILGAKRLLDALEFETGDQGTTVRLEKRLPPRRRVEPGEIQKIADMLARAAAVDPAEELAIQNRDLTRAFEELQKQKQELEIRAREQEQMSAELVETNRGVLALYDELDSLHRLGTVIASQLDLGALCEAIINATTEISGAEFGAFLHPAVSAEPAFYCHTVAGPLREIAAQIGRVTAMDLFGADIPDSVLRIDDLAKEKNPCRVASILNLPSFLSVPVCSVDGEVRAAMIFGHRSPKKFSERNERILSAVSAQAMVGMENARLYTTAQAANDAKDHFLATLSHELRTPLNPIFLILSELRADQTLPARVQEDLDTIQRNLNLEAKLIDDLLDVTRIIRGKFNLRYELNDVHDLLKRTSETCLSASAQKTFIINFQLNADQHLVSGDPTRLQQVFWNLLNNAIKFTPAGGSVSILTRNLGDTGAISIEFIDTGRGIPAAMIDKVFRPFEQGDRETTAEYGGLGLGLTIAQAIVEAHGGKIEARSPGAGQGATFIVILTTTPAGASPSVKTDAAEARPRSKWSILAVDDHADTLATLERVLKRRGHTVTSAGDASAAATLANSQHFDFLISDIGLPGQSGLELMRELAHLKAMKGIALSGYGAEADISQSKEAGFIGHLTKPIDLEELLDLMEKVANADAPESRSPSSPGSTN